jgi:hypothetical protein
MPAGTADPTSASSGATPPQQAAAPERPRPAWALPVVVVAVVAIAVALVVGLRGLGGDPVRSTAADGTATLSGAYQPVSCDSGCVQGYLQAGARSVFVRLPAGCPAPHADQQVTVQARPDTSLGKHAYTALACPTG